MSSFWGGSKSAEAEREAKRRLAAEKAKLEAERTRKLNENYLDTSAGQNLIRVARNAADRNWKKAAGAAAVGGSTDAAAQMAKDAGNDMVGEAVANIAAQDTARKDNIDASYRADIGRLNQQEIASKQGEGQAIAQAAAGASNALMSGALTTFGGTKLGQSLQAPATTPAAGTVAAGSPAGGGVGTTVQPYNDIWSDRLIKMYSPNYRLLAPQLPSLYKQR